MGRSGVIGASVLALLVASSAAAQTPTLGELARREQERRKALKGTAKVLTAQDVPKTTPAAPPPAAAAPSADAKEKPGARPEEPPRDEAYWRARIGAVREELRRNEMFAEALQTRINALAADWAARDDPYQRARISDDRVKALAELDRVKSDVELQKKRVADIEEEARRAGVPPGWLR